MVDPQHASLTPLTRRLWKAAGLMVILLATFLVINPFLPKDKALVGADLGHDFLAFYTAGTFARQGDYAGMYNLRAVQQFQQTLAASVGLEFISELLPWWNPPFAALAIEPLSLLPYRTARLVWIGINLTCVLAACGLLMRMIAKLSDWRHATLVPAILLTSMPFLLLVTHGQNTGISLLLLTAVVVLWRARSALAAGAVCGLLFYKPQLGALVAIALTIRLGPRALLGVGCTGVVLLVVTNTTMPGALGAFLLDMPANLTAFQEKNTYYWERHVTFKALWRLMIQGHATGPTATSVVVLWTTCTLALGGWLLKTLWRRDGQLFTEDRAIAATIVCSPLLMPFYFDYDLLLLAIPITLYAVDRLRSHLVQPFDRWTTITWTALTAYMLVHLLVAERVNVNGTTVLLIGCAGVTLARRWNASGDVPLTLPNEAPATCRMAA